MRDPDTFILHPADFAELMGVRRTRGGRWVWKGRTYRTRKLALRRVPCVVHVEYLGRVHMDGDGVTRRGTMLVLRAQLPPLYSMSPRPHPGGGFWEAPPPRPSMFAFAQRGATPEASP